MKENRQGCLSRAVKPLFPALKKFEKVQQAVEKVQGLFRQPAKMPLLSRRTAALAQQGFRGIRFHAGRAAAPSRSPAPTQPDSVQPRFFDTLSLAKRLFRQADRAVCRDSAYRPVFAVRPLSARRGPPGQVRGGRFSGRQGISAAPPGLCFAAGPPSRPRPAPASAPPAGRPR